MKIKQLEKILFWNVLGLILGYLVIILLYLITSSIALTFQEIYVELFGFLQALIFLIILVLPISIFALSIPYIIIALVDYLKGSRKQNQEDLIEFENVICKIFIPFGLILIFFSGIYIILRVFFGLDMIFLFALMSICIFIYWGVLLIKNLKN